MRAACDVDAGHALEEGGGIFLGLSVRGGHGQRRTGSGHALGIDGRAEQAVVADALEAGRQDVLQERGDEGGSVDQHGAFAAVVVGANAQSHAGGGIDFEDALVGDRDPVGVAREVVEHHLGAGQRRWNTWPTCPYRRLKRYV